MNKYYLFYDSKDYYSSISDWERKEDLLDYINKESHNWEDFTVIYGKEVKVKEVKVVKEYVIDEG